MQRARAGWFGLAGWHDGADMLRALFEGVAFAHLAHLARLETNGVGADDITLSGGGAKSPVWPQMIADMLGRPVKVAAETRDRRARCCDRCCVSGRGDIAISMRRQRRWWPNRVSFSPIPR